MLHLFKCGWLGLRIELQFHFCCSKQCHQIEWIWFLGVYGTLSRCWCDRRNCGVCVHFWLILVQRHTMFESVDNATGPFCHFAALIVHVVIQIASAQHFREFAVVANVVQVAVQWMREEMGAFGGAFDFDVIEMLFLVGHDWASGSGRAVTTFCGCVPVFAWLAFHQSRFTVRALVVPVSIKRGIKD